MSGRLLTGLALSLLDRGLLPDAALRLGIRRLLAERLRAEGRDDPALREARQERLAASLAAGPLAVATEIANTQHYELPTELFATVLGPRMKYSSALWPTGTTDLAGAEEAMLDLTARRTGLADAREVLELGCGWGSLTFWALERYPGVRWTALTNSRTQAEHLRRRADELGVGGRLTVVRRDVEDFAPTAALDRALGHRRDAAFDRVVSVEMFEHVRNYPRLFRRIAGWLAPGGELFVHVFCHGHLAYPFEAEDESDWMARHFFTGGMMPSFDLLPRFAGELRLEGRWWINGTHYARTAQAWRENQDRARDRLFPVFRATYREPAVWWRRWRVFFLACEELFGYHGGEEWGVGHYRWSKPA